MRVLLRIQVHKAIDAATLARRLPDDLAALIAPRELPDPPFDALVFGRSQRVVTESRLQRGMARREETTRPVVVVAHRLTRDARAWLERQGIVWFAEESGFWSDASLHQIRQAIGSRGRIRWPPGTGTDKS